MLGPGPAVRILPSDLRERIRRGRTSALVLFIVDASGSMDARDRMSAAKSYVLGLLLDAYRRRDRVGLIAFRGNRAETLLPFTNSVELAEQRLRYLPTGGRTPLAGALELGQQMIERALQAPKALAPLVVLVSDGRANVELHGIAPWPAAMQQAEQVRAHGWPTLVVDPEAGRAGTGLGRALASALGADLLALGQLRSREDLA
jgi:magnesium chelatase subunit D